MTRPAPPFLRGAMLVRHTILYGIASAVPGLVNFLALALYTRLLPPQEYGQYALVVAWVSLISAISFQWLRLGARRFLIRFSEKQVEFLSTLLVLYLAIVATSGLLTLGLLLLRPAELPTLLVVLGSALLWAQSWTELSLEMVMAKLRPGRYGLLVLARSLIAVLVGATLIHLGYGAAGLLAGLALGYFVPGAWLAWRLWRPAVQLSDWQPRLLRVLLSYGLPLAATGALEFIVNASDRMLLSWFRGSEAVGVYAASYDLAMQSLTMIMVAVNLAAFPMTVRALEDHGVEAARDQMVRQSIVLFSIALPAASGLALLTPNVAETILGPEFRISAVSLLPLVAAAALCFGIKSLYFDLAFQLGRSTVGQVWASGAAAAINIGLNLWLIPRYGPVGAAYATIAAYAAGLAMSVWLGRRVFRVPIPWVSWAKVGFSTGVMVLGLWPLLNLRGAAPLVLQVTWGALLFFGMLALLDVGGLRAWLTRRLFPA